MKLRYQTATQDYIRAKSGKILCPHCGDEMLQENEHGTFTCFCIIKNQGQPITFNHIEGVLCGIATKPSEGAPMVLHESIKVSVESGLDGDFLGKGGREKRRQATSISTDQWTEAQRALGVQIPWIYRRANLLCEGFVFHLGLVDYHMRIGDQVLLRITKETKPCPKIDKQHPGLCDALTPDWRGGVCSTVINGGTINVGDRIIITYSK